MTPVNRQNLDDLWRMRYTLQRGDFRPDRHRWSCSNYGPHRWQDWGVYPELHIFGGVFMGLGLLGVIVCFIVALARAGVSP